MMGKLWSLSWLAWNTEEGHMPASAFYSFLDTGTALTLSILRELQYGSCLHTPPWESMTKHDGLLHVLVLLHPVLEITEY